MYDIMSMTHVHHTLQALYDQEQQDMIISSTHARLPVWGCLQGLVTFIYKFIEIILMYTHNLLQNIVSIWDITPHYSWE